MKISGFTFVHNGIIGGYPILEAIESVSKWVDEIVVVDCQSTDNTVEKIQQLANRKIRIIKGSWGNLAGETLANAHAQNTECYHDTILHFEADEVYSQQLLSSIMAILNPDIVQRGVNVHRIQVEQNFQRVRWYPEPVQRIFKRGTVIKRGHTTNKHFGGFELPESAGLLWDCTNCFRDNWKLRLAQQQKLWHGDTQRFLRVPLHFAHDIELNQDDLSKFLDDKLWTLNTTWINIPNILTKLVGKTQYDVY